MSAEQLSKLVMMANQIATAFDGQGGDAVSDTAAHMKAFWAPQMRGVILRHAASGGAGLNATAKLAAARLAALQADAR